MLYHTTNILNFIQNVIDQYTKFFTSRVQGIPVLLIIILIYPQICFELGFQDGTGFFLIHLFPIKCTCFWQFSTLWLCNKVYNSTNPAYKKEKRVLCNYQALRVFIIQWIFRCLRSKTFLKLEVIKTIMSVLFVPCFWRGG